MTHLVVTLKEPTHIGTRVRSDAVRQTESHIPGWTVRGAFAAAWIREHGEPTTSNSLRAEFIRLFEGGVRFGPLYAGDPPVSLAVSGHKYPPQVSCRDIDFDAATLRQVPEDCPECHEPLEQQRGLRDIEHVRPNRRPGVAIGPDGVAVDGMLYLIDSLPAQLRFAGQLIGDAGDVEALVHLPGLRFGGRRVTRGRAEARLVDSEAEGVSQRIAPDTFVVRLGSPAVFVDGQGRPVPAPSAQEMSDVLGTDVKVVRQWSRWEMVGGWHAASGLPKPVETVVSAGSTYLCRSASPVPDEALVRLFRRGLGLRRHEGFGHLAGPSTLTMSTRQRAAIHARLDSVKNNQAVPPSFLTMLRRVCLFEAAASDLEALVAEVGRIDRFVEPALRGLAHTPVVHLRQILREAGDL